MAWFLNILDAICILLCFTPNRYPFTEFGKNSTKVSKWVKNNAWFLAWFLTILDAICILIYFTPNIYPFTEFGKNSTKVSKWVKTWRDLWPFWKLFVFLSISHQTYTLSQSLAKIVQRSQNRLKHGVNFDHFGSYLYSYLFHTKHIPFHRVWQK
jgi:hypothetical protein